MKRLFWLGAGIAVGVLVVRRLGRAAHAYSPAGMAETARNSAAGVMDSVRDFIADVREGMAEREAQIKAAFVNGESIPEDDDFDSFDYFDEYDYDDDSTDRTR